MMLFIVLTVLLSFGYNIEQNHSEIIVPYLQDVLSTPPSQITKDENLIDNQIKSNLSYLPSKQHTSKEQTISNSENDQCKWTISDQYYTTDPTTGTSDKIDSAIRYCSDPEGYEIVLIDSKHNEDLNLDNDSPILIKGGNQKQTIWYCEEYLLQYTISLENGNHTLQNLEFQFKESTGPDYLLYPMTALIYVGDYSHEHQEYSQSITIRQCIFNSYNNFSQTNMYHIQSSGATKVEIINCTFKGVTSNELSSSIYILDIQKCAKIILNGTIFSDLSIRSQQSPIFLSVGNQSESIVVQDCTFININFDSQIHQAALYIERYQSIKVDVIRNIFNKCVAYDSNSGALHIQDKNNNNDNSIFNISNNQFSNNQGKKSGAIFLESKNCKTQYFFTNNSFTSNKNSISDGIGQDAYMNFTNLPTEWTIDNIEDKTKEMFNGSTSDAYESIYYEVYNNNSLFTSGNISIYDNPPPEPPKQKQKLSTGQIVGIVVGCISFVALIIVIIIISVLYYNKV